MQVQKYLKLRVGPVAYLTTRDIPTPAVNSKFFLGHSLLESLHGRLERKRLTPTGELLLDFMEEYGMSALEPFTKADLRNAVQSFNLVKKCRAMLEEVSSAVEPECKKMFHKRTKFMPCYYNLKDKAVYSAIRGFSYGIAVEFCLFLEPWKEEVGFGVSVWVRRESIYKIKRYLHSNWAENRNEVYSWHQLKPAIKPSALVKLALCDFRALKTALDKA